MKILQIVTYASADGAFGGPLAVAIAQSVELARLGHEVELVAGWDGAVSIDAPGVRLMLFPTRRILRGGFSGLYSPRLQKYVRRAIRRFDVVHVHLGRDLITTPAAACAVRLRAKTVLQTHGMVMPDARFQAKVFDRIWTRRLLRKAHNVLYLTQAEKTGLETIAPQIATFPITNGVEVVENKFLTPRSTNDILFLARLHPRKRVLDFARAAATLAADLPSARFSIVGPDEGDLAALQQFIDQEGLKRTLIYEGTLPPGASRARLSRAAIYVLPSVGEVVPMSLLEAMSVGTPCVITGDNGLAASVKEAKAGIVAEANPVALASAIRALLVDAERRNAAGIAARGLISTTFSVTAVARSLVSIYARPGL